MLPTFREAQQDIETRQNMQWARNDHPTVYCETWNCRERAVYLLGMPDSPLGHSLGLCEKHAKQLATTTPRDLLPVEVTDGQTSTLAFDNAPARAAEGAQATDEVADNPSDTPGNKTASDYRKECCGEVFTRKTDYMTHRRVAHKKESDNAS